MKTKITLAGIVLAILSTGISSLFAQTRYNPADFFKQGPTQSDVQIDTPEASEIANCKVIPHTEGNFQVVCVYAPDGVTPLRAWVAPARQTGVEQVRFYKDGQEVFRDILSAKECRWLNSGGSRWGVLGPDKKIVSWKSISPEEATAEAVAALVTKDVARYKRVALSLNELKTLGLTGSIAAEIEKQITSIDTEFANLVATLNLPADVEWGAFNGNRPATIPEGKEGFSQDVSVYYNTSVVIMSREDRSRSQQLYIGDLVRVGDTWKIVGLPAGEPFGQATGEVTAASVFFPTTESGEMAAGDGGAGAMGEAGQQLTDAYQELDNASPEDYPAQVEKTFNLILTLAANSPAEQTTLVRQGADLICNAIQTGNYPQGTEKLASLYDTYKDSGDMELKAAIRFRQILGDYYAVMQTNPRPKESDMMKAQAKYSDELIAFADEFSQTTSGAEAMMSLALDQEYAREKEAAMNYYATVAKNFPETPSGKKAAGAVARLQSEGKSLPLPPCTFLDGSQVNLAAMAGKPVVIFCWASWAVDSINEMVQLTQRNKDFNIIGLNLDAIGTDTSAEEQADYFKSITAKIPWNNICDPAGLEGTCAQELGIPNAPWIILIDAQGKVLNSDITSIGDLEVMLNSLK